MNSSVQQRLEALEKSHDLLRKGVASVLVLASGLVCIGAISPTPHTLSAERFLLTDATGKERAELSTNKDSTALQFLNANGTKALVLAVAPAGNGVIVSDVTGKHRELLLTSDDGSATFAMVKAESARDAFTLKDVPEATVLSFHDNSGIDRLDMGYHPKGSGFVIADTNGATRVAAFEQGFATYKPDGDLEWASAGENLSPQQRQKVMGIINSAPK